jgi:uncharacterized protein YjbI with pentapeptide repeats
MACHQPSRPVRRIVLIGGVARAHGNLSGANLSMAHLRRANLSGADLSGANLEGADLSEANLRKAARTHETPGFDR